MAAGFFPTPLFKTNQLKRNMKHHKHGVTALAGACALILNSATAAVVTFEEITLPGSGYLKASSPAGGFNFQGTTFRNNYNSTYDSWSGFAISNQTDTTTAGWGNQYRAYTGGGQGGSTNYAVGFYATYEDSTHITFAGSTNLAGMGASFSNTTYAAISMRDGDAFAKKFGGITGNDTDWLKLTIEGYEAGILKSAVELYLADFRFSDNSQDFILNTWAYVDFSPLGTVDQLRFSMSSSDNGAFGMNTPAFFAMDTIAVPEPSALLCSLAGLGLALRRRREPIIPA